MMKETRSFVVTEELSGTRLDRFLETLLKGFTRSRIKVLIEEGWVKIQGEKAKKGGQKVRAGSVVEVTIPPLKTLELVPLEMELDILCEDEHLLVLDKPAGLVVHPAPGHDNDTLVNALLAHCKNLKGIGGTERPGIVHRLDKDTSGLLVVAKDEETHRGLVEQFKQREVEKVYLALIFGTPYPTRGTITAPIGRHPIHRKKMAVVEKGLEALTRYRVLASGKGISLIEAKIETGRTHQIRVHMHHIGHPVVGDPVYKGKPPRDLSPSLKETIKALGRQALHHHRMRFTHPITGKEMSFVSPLPEDMLSILEEAGIKANPLT